MADPLAMFNTIRQMRDVTAEENAGVKLTNPGAMFVPVQDAFTDSGYAPVSSRGTDLRELPRSPGDPRFRHLIPPPACVKCGADHHPHKSYDHPHDSGEAKETPMMQNSPQPLTPMYLPPAASAQRVAIYVGRGESFVLKVEENPPDWDDVYTKKMQREQVQLVLPILRVLGIKVKDLTGGELDEPEEDREQPRPPTSIGGTIAESTREWAEFKRSHTPQPGTASRRRSVRSDTDGQSDAADHSAADAGAGEG